MSFRCRYPGCERIFDTKIGRATHERFVHEVNYYENKPNYVCTYCGAVFETNLRFQAHLRDHHGIPSKTLDWVENKTFENLVHLYNEELHKISTNNIITGILNERERSRLLREGVLVIAEHGRMGKKTVYKLTEEALETLRLLDNETSEAMDEN